MQNVGGGGKGLGHIELLGPTKVHHVCVRRFHYQNSTGEFSYTEKFFILSSRHFCTYKAMKSTDQLVNTQSFVTLMFGLYYPTFLYKWTLPIKALYLSH